MVLPFAAVDIWDIGRNTYGAFGGGWSVSVLDAIIAALAKPVVP